MKKITLSEYIVYVFIIAGVSLYILNQVATTQNAATASVLVQTRESLKRLADAIDRVFESTQKPPSSMNDIIDALHASSTLESKTPSVTTLESDIWGNKWYFIHIHRAGKDSYGVGSSGPDGIFANRDDIIAWAPQHFEQ